ncbi:unnamed protein product [Paramecium sonneborni]|uniref:Uncharacterized protein n=1 Tax=Paramecium sonneborni TaxID=65129 RepID=A0A8S1RPX5_9CILI|nr:unnamed protein product [Paramecium sonneborni]
MQIQNQIGEMSVQTDHIYQCLTEEGNICTIKIYKEGSPRKLIEKEIKIQQSISHLNIKKIVVNINGLLQNS